MGERKGCYSAFVGRKSSLAVFGLAFLTGMMGSAEAQIRCAPWTVSGTTVLTSCTDSLAITIPATQGAIFGSQAVATQSNNVVMDRLSELRASQASAGTQAASFADPMAYAAMPRKAPNPIPAALAATPPVRPAFWVRGYGDFEEREGSASVTVPGAGAGTLTFDQRYRQRAGGVLAGGDLIFKGITSADDALILGVLGGYSASRITLSGTGRHELDGGSVGVYGTYLKGNFFLDAMFKVDFLEFETNIVLLPTTADVRNYSFLANVGYKFDLQRGWYFEPTIGIEHVRTEFSNQAFLATSIVTLEDASLTRGRFGARIGTSWIQDNLRIEPSLALFGHYYFEATGATVQLGGTSGTIVLPTDEGKLRGELQGSVNVFNLTTGVSGFLRGDLRFGDDVIGGGARAGIRIQK